MPPREQGKMSMSVNKVILIGHLGKDPEVKTLNNGNKMVTFQLATSKKWRDKEGERKEKTSWHRVVVYNKNLVEIAEKYFHKGSKVYVEGELDQREYEKEGEKRTITEVLISGFSGTCFSLEKSEGSGAPQIPPADDSDYGELPYGG